MKSKICLIAALCLVASWSSATLILIDNTTQNGSFEDPTSGKVMVETGLVPHWQTWTGVATVSNDTGTDIGGAPTDGARILFIQPNGAVVNMTSYLAAAGDVFTYRFDNTLSGRAAASMDLVWNNGGTFSTIPGTTIGGGPVATFSDTFTVQAGDAWEGQAIGVGLSTSGNWPELDQVGLSVTSIPEPSTLAFAALALGALLLCRVRKI